MLPTHGRQNYDLLELWVMLYRIIYLSNDDQAPFVVKTNLRWLHLSSYERCISLAGLNLFLLIKAQQAIS